MSLKVTPREFTISIGEKEYFLSPTFSAILDIEQRSGKGINVILQNLVSGAFSFTDLVTLIWSGIRANYRVNKKDMKDLIKWDDLAEEIQSFGYVKIIPDLADYVGALLNGVQSIEEDAPKGESTGNTEKN